jgi:predicted flap endonuclease-1-like 5' DNA nuclease
MNTSRLVKTLVWVVLGATAALLGRWLARLLKEEEDSEPAAWVPIQRSAEVTTVPAPPQEPVRTEFEVVLDDIGLAGQRDDLTRIDGIGPRYAEGLVALGITTFRGLSVQTVDSLVEGLRTQGLRIIGDRIVQDDWIGQARQLMAEG